jgi:hypothetical protein
MSQPLEQVKRVEAALWELRAAVEQLDGRATQRFAVATQLWAEAIHARLRAEAEDIARSEGAETLWTVYTPIMPGLVREVRRTPSRMITRYLYGPAGHPGSQQVSVCPPNSDPQGEDLRWAMMPTYSENVEDVA